MPTNGAQTKPAAQHRPGSYASPCNGSLVSSRLRLADLQCGNLICRCTLKPGCFRESRLRKRPAAALPGRVVQLLPSADLAPTSLAFKHGLPLAWADFPAPRLQQADFSEAMMQSLLPACVVAGLLLHKARWWKRISAPPLDQAHHLGGADFSGADLSYADSRRPKLAAARCVEPALWRRSQADQPAQRTCGLRPAYCQLSGAETF